RAIHQLVTLTEENNVALTQVFSNTLWQKYGSFLSSTQSLSNQQLVTHPKNQQLNQEILRQFESLSVAKVKVYDLQGRTVFSTDFSQIGDDKSQSSGFLSAKSGEIISQLGHRDTFKALQTTLENRDFLSSYIPILNNGEIVGVFELYTDVTPLLQRINRTQSHIILGSLLILTVLYGVLFLFVRRADRLIKNQYQQLQDSESRYRQQATELQDVLTQLRKTQTQIIQTEKMSSLGQMVAGVAHEINNPVSFIHGNLVHVQEYAKNLLSLVQLYQQHYPNPVPEIQIEAEEIDLEFIQEDLPKIISSMKIGSNRIREIVLALRIFSRLHEAEVKAVNLHEGIDSTLMILQHRLKASPEHPEIKIIKDYGTLPEIECFSGLLNQVFMNILSNAIDALEEKIQQQTPQERIKHPSRIKISTTIVNKKWVKIAIADNGSGIPPEVQRKIFDPFFTTKPIGKGTGMGMSISYQIITERHNGKLKCFSTPGQGTKFIMQIPILQTKIKELPHPPKQKSLVELH
ncbi:MAG: ATP-binding protein, partial [Cyanobacteriota bacterium]|nr:ATP-binding protein [Cyanobacteriota bacterium]